MSIENRIISNKLILLCKPHFSGFTKYFPLFAKPLRIVYFNFTLDRIKNEYPMISRRSFIQYSSAFSLPLFIPFEVFGRLEVVEAEKKHLKSSKDPDWLRLSKITYGPTAYEFKKIKKGGFKAYIAEQLNAPLEDDKDIQNRLSTLKLDIKYEYNGYSVDEWRNLSFLDKDLPYCRREFEKTKDRGWFEWIRPGMEVACANWIRAVYSPWQLREMMVEFWHNHFNITLNGDMAIGCSLPAYDRDVMRKNAFGNFRVLLEEVAKSPAMLYYLNNKSSQASPANENYARELFELHTLGQENYFNNLYDKWRDVPGALEGKPAGYIDEDVYEAARAFTGWTVADGSPYWRSSATPEHFPNTGEFYYFEGWHDNYQKRILGYEIRSNMPAMYDGRKVLDLVAAHPGTARHLCKKILLRFMGENYPETLLTKATAVWMDNLNAPDQIKKVLEVIFTSEEFMGYTDAKVKRPYEFIVSIARTTKAEFTPTMMLQWITMGMGYKPFMWPAPTGHPDKDSYWIGPGAMVTRWKTGGTILYWKEMGVFHYNFSEQTPEAYSYSQIVDFWSEKITGGKLHEKYRTKVANVFSQGESIDLVPNLSVNDMEKRLTTLAQFLISTPDFQIR